VFSVRGRVPRRQVSVSVRRQEGFKNVMVPRMPLPAANLPQPCPACGWFRLTHHFLTWSGGRADGGRVGSGWSFVRCEECQRRFQFGPGGELVPDEPDGVPPAESRHAEPSAAADPALKAGRGS
jgi:hypothetical protein